AVEGDDSLANRINSNRIFGNDSPILTPSPSETLKFDGSSYVNLPSGLLDGFQQKQSLEAWFRTSSGGGILGKQSSTIGNFPSGGWTPILYVGTDGKLYGGSYNGGLTQVVSNVTVNDYKWHSVALTVDGATQTETLYLDGQLVGKVSGNFGFLGGLNN